MLSTAAMTRIEFSHFLGNSVESSEEVIRGTCVVYDLCLRCRRGGRTSSLSSKLTAVTRLVGVHRLFPDIFFKIEN